MKLNLLLNNQNAFIPGYTNFDPYATPGSKVIKAGIDNLDYYLDNGECEIIRAVGILTYFDSHEVDNILNNWISKLSINGNLILADVDVVECMKAFNRNEIDLNKLNIFLYGEQNKKINYRKCALSMFDISNFLIQKNMKIVKKYFEGLNFHIEAMRIK